MKDEDAVKKIIDELSEGWKLSSSNLNQYFETLKKNKELQAESEAYSELICPGCGKPYRKGSKFCSSCGRKIDLIKVCVYCGSALKPSAKFCSSCGKSV